MNTVVFKETFRRNWRMIFICGSFMIVLAVYVAVLLNDSKLVEQMTTLLASVPFLLKTFGGGDAAFMASPAGLLNYSFFGWVMWMLSGYAVAAGLNITANEEERGILDVVLSAPLPRWRVLAEKLAAHILVLVGIVLISAMGMVVAVSLSSVLRDQVTPGQLVVSAINMLPSTILVLAFTALAGVVFRRRNTAMMVGTFFVVASFLVETLGRNLDTGGGLRALSYFNYYDSATVMQHGLNVGNVGLLLGAAALLTALTVWRFQRREIGI